LQLTNLGVVAISNHRVTNCMLGHLTTLTKLRKLKWHAGVICWCCFLCFAMFFIEIEPVDDFGVTWLRVAPFLIRVLVPVLFPLGPLRLC
jgi:hypothetical protein